MFLKTYRHIQEWYNHLLRYKRLGIEAARDHFKSWTFSYSYPLWLTDRVDNKQEEPVHIALLSYSEDQAGSNLQRIRQKIESDRSLSYLKPTRKSYTWDIHELNCSNGCLIKAFGFGSSMRGGHFHYMLIDDPTKDHWTMSLEEQENFLYGVAVPATRKDGQMVVTGNPVDLKDVLWLIENNPAFSVFKYPVLNAGNEPLCPEHYDMNTIRLKKSIIPAHIFSREFMLQRVSPDTAAFKQEWFEDQWYEEPPRNSDKSIKQLFIVMTVDPSITEGGDAMGIVVTGTDDLNKTYTLDRCSFHGTVEQGVNKIFEWHMKWNPDTFGIETFIFQKIYKLWIEKEMLKRNHFFGVVELERSEGMRKSKNMRILALTPKIQAGHIYFRPEHRPLVDQALAFNPNSKYNIDDELEALAYQVPLWQAPSVDTKERNLEGTFQGALDKLKSRQNAGYVANMFDDLHSEEEGSEYLMWF